MIVITHVIEEIYEFSDSKYHDLYNIFFNNCGFQILSISLAIGFNTCRARDYQDLKEI